MEKIKAEKVGRMLALAHLWVSSDIPTQPRRGVEEKESGKQSSLHSPTPTPHKFISQSLPILSNNSIPLAAHIKNSKVVHNSSDTSYLIQQGILLAVLQIPLRVHFSPPPGYHHGGSHHCFTPGIL